METKYDRLISQLLDNWVIAIIVIIAVILMAVPKVRDGIRAFFSLFKRKKEFVSEYADEIHHTEEVMRHDLEYKGLLIP